MRWIALLLLVPLASAGLNITDVATGLDRPVARDAHAADAFPMAQDPPTEQEVRAQARADLTRFLENARLRPDDPDLPIALRQMDMMLQGNHTNGTVLAHDHNGTNSHRHGAVGGDGLDAVWTTAFYGTPRIMQVADVDGDGVADAVVGSDTALFAISGTSAERLWARHIGSTISAIDVADVHPRSGTEIIFSTYWEGQRARVAAVDPSDGALLWEHVGQTSFLGAAATGDGHVVAVDILGQHTTIDGVSGEAVRTVQPDLIPSTGAVVAAYYNLGHYLADFADVTGDGVIDSVSVGLHYYYAMVPLAVYTFNTYSTVYVVDGATGETAWLHPVMTEPGADGFTQTVLTALSPLDHDGDGTQEVAFAGLSFRYHGALSLAGISYESFLRVIDQQGPVAVPVSTKELVSPLLPLELISKIEPVDVQGDGLEEMGVLRFFLVDSLLEGSVVNYERYAVAGSATGDPTMVLLSDHVFRFSTGASLWRGDQGIHILTMASEAGGRALGVAPDGSTAFDVEAPSGVATTATMAGQRLLLGTRAALELRDDDLSKVSASFAVRGVPVDFATADHDGDGYTDAFIASTDGNVHIIDGLTGRIMQTIDLEGHIRRIAPTGDGAWFIVYDSMEGRFVQRWEGSTSWTQRIDSSFPTFLDMNADGTFDLATRLEADTVVLNGKDGTELMSTQLRGVYFPLRGADGDMLVVQEGVSFFDEARTFAAVDAAGEEAWRVEIATEYYFDSWCVTSADLDGDGQGSLVVLHGYYGIDGVVVGWGGDQQPLPRMPSMERLYGCFVDAVPTHGADELLIGLVYRTPDWAIKSGFGRHNGTAWGWQSFASDRFEALGGIVPLGVHPGGAGGRFYYGDEDHVIVARWDTGEQLGQFTLDGPAVLRGAVVDLDRRAPAEVLALSADGLLWALATDAEAVTQALIDEATRQGKVADDVLDQRSPGKESPGVFWGILAVVLVALARRRA